MKYMRMLALTIAVWSGSNSAVLSAPVATAISPPRAETLIREVILSDGTRRYAVPILIGATSVDAGLDSGSTGLRLLPRGTPSDLAGLNGRSESYSYQAGAKLDGVMGAVVVSIGSPAVAGKIPVHLVRSVGCRKDRPNCAAGRIPLRDYGIQGDGLPGEGFKAILGINMGDAATPNPLVRLGVRRWIVELPRPGEGAPGRLILNPTDEETRGYLLLHLDAGFNNRNGGFHDAIRGCLVNRTNNKTLCGPMLLDTGAPGLRIVASRPEPAWPDATPAQLVLVDGSKPLLASDFTIGRREFSSRFTVEIEPVGPEPRLFVGLLPYFAYSVLYDSDAGVIGFKARTDAKTPG